MITERLLGEHASWAIIKSDSFLKRTVIPLQGARRTIGRPCPYVMKRLSLTSGIRRKRTFHHWLWQTPTWREKWCRLGSSWRCFRSGRARQYGYRYLRKHLNRSLNAAVKNIIPLRQVNKQLITFTQFEKRRIFIRVIKSLIRTLLWPIYMCHMSYHL